MDLEEITDNKSIANQINIEATTISTLASSLKTEHGVNIQYDAIIQAANRLFDLAVVRSIGGVNMRVGDLKNYIFDEVVLYRENPEVDGEYIDIHKWFICTSPISILNLKVRTIGAKRKGVVDIRVK